MVNQLKHRLDLVFDTDDSRRGYFSFLAMYFVAFWGEPIYFTYLLVYFRQIGYSTVTIGYLYSIGPGIALLAQPFWGWLSDRSRVKNHVLYVILAGTGITMLLMGFTQSLPIVFIIFISHAFFRSSQHPVEDSLALDFLSRQRLRYGPVRAVGTLGYMFIVLILGWAVKWEIRIIFPLYLAFSVLSILTVRRTPPVKGAMKTRQKFDFKKVKNGKLLLGYILFSFLVSFPYGFYSTFFPLYLTSDLGGSASVLGILMFAMAALEVIFMLGGEKLVNRFGLNSLLVYAGIVSLVRWVLTYLVTDPTTQIFVQMLHGISYMVVHFCLINYIHQCVPPEVSTTGQTLYALVYNGLARILPSLIGGYLSALYGIRFLFLIAIIMLVVSLVLLAFLIHYSKRKGTEDALHCI